MTFYTTFVQVTTNYLLQTDSCWWNIQNHQAFRFPYQKRISERKKQPHLVTLSLTACGVPAAALDLWPFVQGGCGWCKNFLAAQNAQKPSAFASAIKQALEMRNFLKSICTKPGKVGILRHSKKLLLRCKRKFSLGPPSSLLWIFNITILKKHFFKDFPSLQVSTWPSSKNLAMRFVNVASLYDTVQG